MCHQSSVCSSAFTLKHFVHHSTAPLSVVVSSSVRHIFHWCKILTSDWLLSPLQVWSHWGAGCNLKGRVEHEAAAELREKGGRGGGGRYETLPSVDSSLSFVLLFSLWNRLFTFCFIFFSPLPPLPVSILHLVSLFVGAVAVLCVCL